MHIPGIGQQSAGPLWKANKVSLAYGGRGTGEAQYLSNGPCQSARDHALHRGDILHVGNQHAFDAVIARQLDRSLRRDLDDIRAISPKEGLDRACTGSSEQALSRPEHPPG